MLSTFTRLLALSTLCMFITTTTALAAPTVNVVRNFYWVRGKTIPAIRKSMAENGPNRYWAYTSWYVSWDGSCNITLKVTYTYPKLRNRNKIAPDILKKWDVMVTNLKAHEAEHAEHGRKAANEIEQKRCISGEAVTRKWAKQDRVLDKKTDHGKKEGVVLEN